MNSLNIPLDEFIVESFTLKEFTEFTEHKKEKLIMNVLKSIFERSSQLVIIAYEIIGDKIYFFMRWEY